MKYVPKHNAPWTLETLRKRAFREQGGLCYWCREPMKTYGPETEDSYLTGDHLIPRYAGGLTKPGNIVAACRKCNNSRQVETNMPKKGEAQWRYGDDTLVSPFAQLRKHR